MSYIFVNCTKHFTHQPAFLRKLHARESDFTDITREILHCSYKTGLESGSHIPDVGINTMVERIGERVTHIEIMILNTGI